MQVFKRSQVLDIGTANKGWSHNLSLSYSHGLPLRKGQPALPPPAPVSHSLLPARPLLPIYLHLELIWLANPTEDYVSPPPLAVFFCFWQQWAVSSRLAQTFKRDSTPRFRMAMGGTTFLSYSLVSLSTDFLENLVYYTHTGSSYIIERIRALYKILFHFQKLSPCKFGLVKNLPVIVTDPMVCISYTASVGGAFAKKLLT